MFEFLGVVLRALEILAIVLVVYAILRWRHESK